MLNLLFGAHLRRSEAQRAGRRFLSARSQPSGGERSVSSPPGTATAPPGSCREAAHSAASRHDLRTRGRRAGRRGSAGLAIALLALLAALPAAARLDTPTRKQVFEIVWGRVKERHFDPKLGGVDWNAVKKKYQPKAMAAKDDVRFYDLLERMLGELHQSHFALIPPADAFSSEPSKEDEDPGGPGVVGMTVQLVEGQPVITHVDPDGAAAKAGLRPGYVLTKIKGKPVEPILAEVRKGLGPRKVPPTEVGLLFSFALIGRLGGAVGSPVEVSYKDADDKEQTATLVRKDPPGKPVQFGELPPIPTQLETKRLAGGIGYVRFNIFLMDLLEPIKTALAEMSDAPGIILDLRGNVGGIGAMAAGIARSFFDKTTPLGAMKLRQGELKYLIYPADEGKAYRGPLVILTDEASLSTSEIFAAGLQENGRAVVIGRPTGGKVLPSQVERLPGGARLQYAFADFRTPKGILLEARGVTPTIPVTLTRRALLDQTDPILAKAIEYIQQHPKN